MSVCIPCTKVASSQQDVITYYIDLYKSKGIETYIYRLSPNLPFKIVKKALFNKIFNEQIKPNFKNGAEYFFISEFRRN